jgi:hypothetical protein
MPISCPHQDHKKSQDIKNLQICKQSFVIGITVVTPVAKGLVQWKEEGTVYLIWTTYALSDENNLTPPLLICLRTGIRNGPGYLKLVSFCNERKSHPPGN